MITSNRNVIYNIAKKPVIMITLRLLYDYFCFFYKKKKNWLKIVVSYTVTGTSNRSNNGCLKQGM